MLMVLRQVNELEQSLRATGTMLTGSLTHLRISGAIQSGGVRLMWQGHDAT